MDIHGRVRADRVLVLALTIGFATLASLVMHARRIGEASLIAFYVGVVVTVVFSVPIVVWTMRAADARQRFRRAASSTTVAGVLISEVTTAAVVASFPDERMFGFFGHAVSTRDPAWILWAAPFGAVPALVACLALLAATRMIETLSAAPTRDVVSRIAVPLLSAASLAAGASTLLLDRGEGIVAIYGAWSAAVGLAVVALEDWSRLKWLGRLFAGTDPDHILEPCGAESENVVRYVELSYGDSLVRERVGAATYRAPARGEAFALVGFTETDTSRPIRRRIVVAACAACGTVGLVALAVLGS